MSGSTQTPADGKSDEEMRLASAKWENMVIQRGDTQSPSVYGTPRVRFLYLPWYRAWKVAHEDGNVPLDPQWLFHNCAFKVVSGGVMGSVIGVAMGLFLGAMGGESQVLPLVKGREIPQAPFREQMRSSFKSTAGKMRGWAKSFGILTALFEGVECCVEKYRGKTDIWNQTISGCAVGATLSAAGGPSAACVGCVGFASFSVLVDKVGIEVLTFVCIVMRMYVPISHPFALRCILA